MLSEMFLSFLYFVNVVQYKLNSRACFGIMSLDFRRRGTVREMGCTKYRNVEPVIDESKIQVRTFANLPAVNRDQTCTSTRPG